MPTVGTGSKKAHFPYTPAGRVAAARTAKATGKPLTTVKPALVKVKVTPRKK
jgi:hypothetical protein